MYQYDQDEDLDLAIQRTKKYNTNNLQLDSCIARQIRSRKTLSIGIVLIILTLTFFLLIILFIIFIFLSQKFRYYTFCWLDQIHTYALENSWAVISEERLNSANGNPSDTDNISNNPNPNHNRTLYCPLTENICFDSSSILYSQSKEYSFHLIPDVYIYHEKNKRMLTNWGISYLLGGQPKFSFNAKEGILQILTAAPEEYIVYNSLYSESHPCESIEKKNKNNKKKKSLPSFFSSLEKSQSNRGSQNQNHERKREKEQRKRKGKHFILDFNEEGILQILKICKKKKEEREKKAKVKTKCKNYQKLKQTCLSLRFYIDRFINHQGRNKDNNQDHIDPFHSCCSVVWSSKSMISQFDESKNSNSSPSLLILSKNHLFYEKLTCNVYQMIFNDITGILQIFENIQQEEPQQQQQQQPPSINTNEIRLIWQSTYFSQGCSPWYCVMSLLGVIVILDQKKNVAWSSSYVSQTDAFRFPPPGVERRRSQSTKQQQQQQQTILEIASGLLEEETQTFIKNVSPTIPFFISLNETGHMEIGITSTTKKKKKKKILINNPLDNTTSNLFVNVKNTSKEMNMYSSQKEEEEEDGQQQESQTRKQQLYCSFHLEKEIEFYPLLFDSIRNIKMDSDENVNDIDKDKDNIKEWFLYYGYKMILDRTCLIGEDFLFPGQKLLFYNFNFSSFAMSPTFFSTGYLQIRAGKAGGGPFSFNKFLYLDPNLEEFSLFSVDEHFLNILNFKHFCLSDLSMKNTSYFKKILLKKKKKSSFDGPVVVAEFGLEMKDKPLLIVLIDNQLTLLTWRGEVLDKIDIYTLQKNIPELEIAFY